MAKKKNISTSKKQTQSKRIESSVSFVEGKHVQVKNVGNGFVVSTHTK